MEFVIETYSLTKKFCDWWGREKVVAVDNLELKIKQNEVFGLLGPNGSGKTTTIKMLLGLLRPTKGKSLVFGGDSSNPAINKRIGFLPEESYLYKYLSARETLDFYGRLFGLPAKVRKVRIESLLEMVGLKAMANRPVGTFSKGMARRIGLAQALINDPELLILDEPTTGLDPIGTRQIKDLIIELAKRGKTVLLCSHLLADVEDVCDRISIMYGGRVQAQGKVEELLRQQNKCQITTGKLSPAAIEQIKNVIKTEQSEVCIDSPMERLETFFVHTVRQAQQQQTPTSGAVSTTDIGEFLKVDTGSNLLDKLVSAKPVGTERVKAKKAEDSQFEKSVPFVPREQADNELLSKLSSQTKTIELEPVNRKEMTHIDSDQEDIRKQVLDQLLKPEDSQQNKGESSDA